MIRFFLPLFTIMFLFFTYSCGNPGSDFSTALNENSEMIRQQEDGTIALKLEKASCYNSKADPSCNTAEWNFVVSTPGRYNVWLSSATTDTMNLQYVNSVRINLLDELLEAKPVGDRIVLNTSDVKYPWYRADSYMGSVIIQEAGEYIIQVISEKVLPEASKADLAEAAGNTRIMSVILTPMTR